MKKAVSILLCLVMMAVFAAGCGSSQSNSGTSGVAGSASSDAASSNTAAKDDLTPITLSIFMNTNLEIADLNNSTPVGKKVVELTGVKLNWMLTTAGDYREKVALMCASNEYPDMFSVGDATPMLYDNGALLKLDDLIAQYGQDLVKFYGESTMRMCRWSLEDPHLYYIPSGDVENPPQAEIDNAFLLQLRALKDQGYPQIKTLDDYGNVIKNYLAKTPETDGKPTIGLTLCFDDWNAIFSVQNPPAWAAGMAMYNDDGDWYIDINTNKATFRYMTPQYKKAYQWLNNMYNQGLIDRESFTQKMDQYLAKIAEGRVVAFIDNVSWHTNVALDALEKDGKYDRLYGRFCPTIDENTQFGAEHRGAPAPTYGIAISKSCKDPVRAMKYLNFWATDEAQILNQWGIEGVNYTVENGVRVMKPEDWAEYTSDRTSYSLRTGVNAFNTPFARASWTRKDASGQLIVPDTTQAILDKQRAPEKEALAAYGIKFWRELFPDYEKIPVAPAGAGWTINFPTDSKENTIYSNCKSIMTKYLALAIMAKPSEFDDVWSRFMADLEAAGVHEIEKAYEELYVQRLKLYGEN